MAIGFHCGVNITESIRSSLLRLILLACFTTIPVFLSIKTNNSLGLFLSMVFLIVSWWHKSYFKEENYFSFSTKLGFFKSFLGFPRKKNRSVSQCVTALEGDSATWKWYSTIVRFMQISNNKQCGYKLFLIEFVLIFQRRSLFTLLSNISRTKHCSVQKIQNSTDITIRYFFSFSLSFFPSNSLVNIGNK